MRYIVWVVRGGTGGRKEAWVPGVFFVESLVVTEKKDGSGGGR